jgi:hypothetical protein
MGDIVVDDEGFYYLPDEMAGETVEITLDDKCDVNVIDDISYKVLETFRSEYNIDGFAKVSDDFNYCETFDEMFYAILDNYHLLYGYGYRFEPLCNITNKKFAEIIQLVLKDLENKSDNDLINRIIREGIRVTDMYIREVELDLTGYDRVNKLISDDSELSNYRSSKSWMFNPIDMLLFPIIKNITFGFTCNGVTTVVNYLTELIDMIIVEEDSLELVMQKFKQVLFKPE